jgi:hypothetical protein
MISRMMVHVIAFFFVYSVQFVGSPAGLGTRVWLGVIGLLCLVYQAMTSGRCKKIDPNILRAVLLILSLALLSLITVALNSTSDLVFFTYAPSMVTVAFAAFSVAQVVRLAYPKNPGTAAKNIIVTIVAVQLCIAFLMFILPDFASMLNNLQITSDLDNDLLFESVEFRLSGFGAKFFGAGIANCYAMILIATLVRSTELSRGRLIYLAIVFLFIASFGMMMSRTTMIGTGLAIVLLVLPCPLKQQLRSRFLRQRRAFWLSLFIAPIILGAIALVLAPNLVTDIEPLVKFGFELFINYFENGQLESESTTQLLDMYTFNFDLPLMIGDGYYTDPQDPSQYYKGVDIGYIRLIYYFGLPGLVTYLIFQYKAIRMSAEHLGRGEEWKFISVCMLLVLLLNFKGFTDIFVFSIYLYACVLGRDAFFRISKNPLSRERHPSTDPEPQGSISIASTEGPTT